MIRNERTAQTSPVCLTNARRLLNHVCYVLTFGRLTVKSGTAVRSFLSYSCVSACDTKYSHDGKCVYLRVWLMRNGVKRTQLIKKSIHRLIFEIKIVCICWCVNHVKKSLNFNQQKIVKGMDYLFARSFNE